MTPNAYYTLLNEGVVRRTHTASTALRDLHFVRTKVQPKIRARECVCVGGGWEGRREQRSYPTHCCLYLNSYPTGGLHSPYFGTEEETAEEALLGGGTRFAPYASTVSDRISLLSAPAASMFAPLEPATATAAAASAAVVDPSVLAATRALSSPVPQIGGTAAAETMGIEDFASLEQHSAVMTERLGATSPASRQDVVTPTPSVYTIDCVTMMSGPVVPVPSHSARIEAGVATRTLEIFPKSGILDFGKAAGGVLSNALEQSVSLSLEGGHTQGDIFSGLVDAKKAKPVTRILTLYNTGVDSLHYRLDAADLRLAEMFGQLGVGVTVRFRKRVGGGAPTSGGAFVRRGSFEF